MRTILASFLFVDVVGFSKVSATEQHAFKAALVPVLQRGLSILLPQDYRLRDTGDGALITFLSNPEHALYLALWIASDCGNPAEGQVLSLKNLRTGINLGTVRESMDVESRPNYVGDGINAAQRIMDFAQPGQVTASRSYMEAVSLLDSAYAALFVHLGPRADKHGRQHELFSVTPDENVLEHMRRTLAVDQAAEPLDLDLDEAIALSPERFAQPVPATHEAAPPAPPAPPPPPSPPVLLPLPPTLAPPQTSALSAPPTAWEPEQDPVDEPVYQSPLRRNLLGGLVLVALVAAGGLAMAHYLRLRAATTATDPTARPADPPAAPASAAAARPPAAVPSEPTVAPAAPPVAPAASADVGNAADPQPATPKAAEKAKPTKSAAPPNPPAVRTSEPPPPPVVVAPARNSVRCSRIMEKASIGEALSSEEKKELANTC